MHRMQARGVILTHFSQRYPKIPVLSTTTQVPVGVAFDYMTVKLSWIAKLPLHIPSLQEIFKEEEDEDPINDASP